jgi:predicted alpha/beta hydrolase
MLFHVFMPLVTRRFGYFPANRLGIGQDLPSHFAQQWARRLRPSLLVGERQRQQYGATLASYRNLSANALFLAMCDDAFAGKRGAARLSALYPCLVATYETVTRGQMKVRRVGHFAFRSDPGQNWLAQRISAWFLHLG